MLSPHIQPLFLMCPPVHYGVEYVINPWMKGQEGAVERTCAREQWDTLHRLLVQSLGATVVSVEAHPGLPDMVFTANAGLVRGGLCVPSHFRYPERQGEEAHFRDWFEAHGFRLANLPAGIAFEGAGDALFDEADPELLWAAHGFRTDLSAHPALATLFDVEVVSLRLADSRFYHLDTCFCPLPGGFYLWYPPAFDEASRQVIEKRISSERRAGLCANDAAAFACNAVSIGPTAVVLNDATEALRDWLLERGLTAYPIPLTEFLRAGGSARCLSLRLDR